MRRQGPEYVMKYVVLAVALIAATVLTAGCSSSPPDMTVNGTLEIALYQSDSTQTYAAAWNGTAQVTITNPSGTVIGVTTADGQNASQQTPTAEYQYLTYGWTVKVPEGLSFYGISVQGVSGTLHFTQAQMKAGPALCIGDACNSGGL